MKEKRKACRILLGKPERKRTLHGRIILKWAWYGLDLSGSEQGLMEDSFEHGDQSSGSTKCWEVGGFSRRIQFQGISNNFRKLKKKTSSLREIFLHIN
jgi:hypothetical protein